MAKAVSYFIAGTDTDVGKTFVSCGLLEAAKKEGLSTVAFKPVAAGAKLMDGILKNDDAVALQRRMTVTLPYETVNPVCLKEAMAPHIAAEKVGAKISMERLNHAYSQIKAEQADFTLIEGAGGWSVPINHYETLAEFPNKIEAPVILVVGMRLGCLNHAMLTVKAIEQEGAVLAGWIANCIDPEMKEMDENIAYLQSHIQAPLLAEIPFIDKTLINDNLTQSSCADYLSNFSFL